MKYQFSMLRGALELFAGTAKQGFLSHVGVNKEDFKFLVQNQPWLGQDRMRARRAIEAIAGSTMDVIGVPRYRIPAEYVAVVIATLVSPVNVFCACEFMQNMETTQSVLQDGEERDRVRRS